MGKHQRTERFCYPLLEHQLWYSGAILPLQQTGCLIFKQRYVKDDAIVTWVMLVLVAVPCRRRLMNFDVATPKHTVDFDGSTQEIRASVGIVPAWVKDVD